MLYILYIYWKPLLNEGKYLIKILEVLNYMAWVHWLFKSLPCKVKYLIKKHLSNGQQVELSILEADVFEAEKIEWIRHESNCDDWMTGLDHLQNGMSCGVVQVSTYQKWSKGGLVSGPWVLNDHRTVHHSLQDNIPCHTGNGLRSMTKVVQITLC